MDEDINYTVTLTGHQWGLIIDALGDLTDGEDHFFFLATEIINQVNK